MSEQRAAAVAHVGCAGWAIGRRHAALFASAGSHLERYAALFDAVEINSSFYRPHRRSTYERWAAAVPERFRFAVKLPKAITHELRLRESEAALARFLAEASGLGAKLGPLLVQLPPSLTFESRVAECFFGMLRARFAGRVACEPRHASWFSASPDALLRDHGIARVLADPPLAPGAEDPGGARDWIYVRLHGFPRVYYSQYEVRVLEQFALRVRAALAQTRDAWCILDNTALGAAIEDAQGFLKCLRDERDVRDAGALNARPAQARPTQ